jgi:hypothetical protein
MTHDKFQENKDNMIPNGQQVMYISPVFKKWVKIFQNKYPMQTASKRTKNIIDFLFSIIYVDMFIRLKKCAEIISTDMII